MRRRKRISLKIIPKAQSWDVLFGHDHNIRFFVDGEHMDKPFGLSSPEEIMAKFVIEVQTFQKGHFVHALVKTP